MTEDELTDLTLAAARTIIAAALERAAALRLKPLAIAVLDARGVLKAFEAQDGAPGLVRPEIARGKAYGALAIGQGPLDREIPEFGLYARHHHCIIDSPRSVPHGAVLS